jgi:hypothetical protein
MIITARHHVNEVQPHSGRDKIRLLLLFNMVISTGLDTTGFRGGRGCVQEGFAGCHAMPDRGTCHQTILSPIFMVEFKLKRYSMHYFGHKLSTIVNNTPNAVPYSFRTPRFIPRGQLKKKHPH